MKLMATSSSPQAAVIGSLRNTAFSMSVFDVIDMLERNMVARAAVDMIDGDQGMVALRECNVVIGLR
jgi:hypothetical protein